MGDEDVRPKLVESDWGFREDPDGRLRRTLRLVFLCDSPATRQATLQALREPVISYRDERGNVLRGTHERREREGNLLEVVLTEVFVSDFDSSVRRRGSSSRGKKSGGGPEGPLEQA